MHGMNEEAIAPAGVTLYEPSDHAARRDLLYGTIKDRMTKSFPVSYGGVRLDVSDVDYDDPPEFSLKDQKDAMMQGKYLSRRLRGMATLTDEETGDVLDTGKISLMRVPFLSQRGTFIHGGNDYVPISQQRLLPGIYARRKANGGLEAQFNVRRGTGSAFRVAFDPATAQYKIGVRQAHMHMYSLLKDMGVGDDEMEAAWGPDILKANKKGYTPKAIESAYDRIVPYKIRNALELEPGMQPTREQKVKAVKDSMSSFEVADSVMRRNLPGLNRLPKRASKREGPMWEALGLTKAGAALDKAATALEGSIDFRGDKFTPPGVGGILESSRRLLAINRGDEEPDDRDNLRFKRYYMPHELMGERVDMDAGKLRMSLGRRLAKTRKLKSMPPFYFDSYMTGHITGKSSMSFPVEETNPMHLADQHARSTLMGPGGIGDPSAITDEAQAVSPSEFGFIASVEGPESERAGIDVRLATGARIGSDGRVYQKFFDRRAGAMRWMSAEDLDGLVVRLPD